MTVLDLMHQCRDTLQDVNSDYWSDSELLDYYNSGLKSLAAERLEEPKTVTLALLTGINEYQVDGVLRYISAKDSDGTVRKLYPDDETGEDDNDGTIVLDYNRIYVNNPVTNINVLIKHIAIPDNENTNSVVRSGDENALKYYMLSKAYEKDSDMENFQKSQYFKIQYNQEVLSVRKHSKLGYRKQIETTKGYQF